MIGNYVKFQGQLSRIEHEWFGVVIIRVGGRMVETTLSNLKPIHLKIIR